MWPKPINIAQARTYLELMNEKKKKLMFSRCSDNCMATGSVSKSIRRKPCLELMISMWLQIQVYVDQGWRLERAAYVEDLKWTTEYVPPMDEAVEQMRNAPEVQMKEVKFRDAKVIAHVHYIAVDHWRQMGGAKGFGLSGAGFFWCCCEKLETACWRIGWAEMVLTLLKKLCSFCEFLR